MPSKVCPEDKFHAADYTCQPCETKYEILKGYEFSPHCGLDDRGNPRLSIYQKCGDGTFNSGSSIKCQKCDVCLSPQLTASPCRPESDTVCCRRGEHVLNGRCVDEPVMTTVTTESTTDATSVSITEPSNTSSPLQTNSISLTGIWLYVGILSILFLVCLLFFLWKRNRGCRQTKAKLSMELEKCCAGASDEALAKRSICQSASYSKIQENSITEHVIGSSCNLLAPEIQAAPLSTVLNNLDVLQELVLLLDPNTTTVKNTRHLAAQCSFSFAWINYAYSMKDHKSPLVAVLEGVITKHPEWTVGHLAGLLTGIGRNDAVEILAKLPAPRVIAAVL